MSKDTTLYDWIAHRRNVIFNLQDPTCFVMAIAPEAAAGTSKMFSVELEKLLKSPRVIPIELTTLPKNQAIEKLARIIINCTDIADKDDGIHTETIAVTLFHKGEPRAHLIVYRQDSDVNRLIACSIDLAKQDTNPQALHSLN